MKQFAYDQGLSTKLHFLMICLGSTGTAVVTDKHALLWTDGRYYLQATQQLDSNWMMAAETIMIMIVFKVAIVVQKKKMNLKQTKFNAFR